jgi:hypothetical protein
MDLIDIIKFRQWPQLPQLPPRYTIALGPSGGVPTSTGPGRLTTTAGRGGPGGGQPPGGRHPGHPVRQRGAQQCPHGAFRADVQTPP